MAIHYLIDTELRLIRTIVSGSVADADLLAQENRLTRQPAYDPGFSQLIDATQLEHAEMSDATARELAARNTFGRSSRRAFVVQRALFVGLVRRFQIYRELSGGTEQIQIFSDMDEALAWLGVPAQMPQHLPATALKAVGHYG